MMLQEDDNDVLTFVFSFSLEFQNLSLLAVYSTIMHSQSMSMSKIIRVTTSASGLIVVTRKGCQPMHPEYRLCTTEGMTGFARLRFLDVLHD